VVKIYGGVVVAKQVVGKVFKDTQQIILNLCCHVRRNRSRRKAEFGQVDFVLIGLLVVEGPFLQHAVAKLSDGRSPQPVEGRHGSVARDPVREGPARHPDAVLCDEAARGLFLGMAKVV